MTASDLDLNNRVFGGVQNYHDGDLNDQTRFHYYQRGDVVWGTMEGGDCAAGNLIATVRPDGKLDMRWQFINSRGEIITGTCISTPELLPDGRYRLNESWTVLEGGDFQGESAIEELAE